MTNIPPPPQQRSFWSQYGRWILLGSIGVGVIFVGLIASIVFGVFAVLKHSDATVLAVRVASQDPRVGGPLTVGRVGGNINTENGAGKAKLEIPVIGPKGTGTLYANEVKVEGSWHIETLDYKAAGTDEPTRIYPANSSPADMP